MSRGARDVPDLAPCGPAVEARLALNRSERLYLALEGVAGTIAHVHVLRFDEAHTDAQLRAGVRELVRTCPRLRALIEPHRFGHRLCVLSDGERIERLFEQAFCVVPGAGDAVSLHTFLNQLANEPFDLERALPLRARVLTGGSRPILVLSLHHVVCDGRGAIQLLDRLMAHLNGGTLAVMPLDDASMLPAILPRLAPGQFLDGARRLWRSLRRRARWRGRPALSLVKERTTFGPIGVRLHDVPVALAVIKAAARARDCTVTELLLAALTASFAGRAQPRAGAVATVRLSLDLRRYFPAARRPAFGNYVASFLVRATGWNQLEATVAELRAQLREVIGRFERKEMSVPLLLAELAPRLLGRRLLAWCVRALKRRARLAQVTLHYSNLGDVDLLNRHGARARAGSLAFFTPALGPYVGCVGLAGRLSLGVSYPRAEIGGSVIDDVLSDFDSHLRALTR
jgi:hypothetical protein